MILSSVKDKLTDYYKKLIYTQTIDIRKDGGWCILGKNAFGN